MINFIIFCGIIYLKGDGEFIARFARQIKPLNMVAFPSPKYYMNDTINQIKVDNGTECNC